MDNIVEKYKLTDAEQEELSKKLEEENKKDFEESVKSEKEANPVSGLPQIVVESSTNPETGETFIGKEIDDEIIDELDIDDEDIMSKFGKSIAAANQTTEIYLSDIAETLKDTSIGDLSKISVDSKNQLVEIINDSIKNPDKHYTMDDMPKEIQYLIEKYFGKVVAPINTGKFFNDSADELIIELKGNASINRSLDEFNKQTNLVYNEAQDELLPMIQDYENNREKALREALKEVDDDEDKKYIEDSLDAMADAYSLNSLIEAAPRIKIKHFDLEKPMRVFDGIHFKYKKDTRYNIYRLDTAVPQLSSNLLRNKMITEEDANSMKSATIFMIAFAKFCMNFKPQNVKEHTFMYYVLYNIYLLNVYHGKSYNGFAPQFLQNVMKVVSTCKV